MYEISMLHILNLQNVMYPLWVNKNWSFKRACMCWDGCLIVFTFAQDKIGRFLKQVFVLFNVFLLLFSFGVPWSLPFQAVASIT